MSTKNIYMDYVNDILNKELDMESVNKRCMPFIRFIKSKMDWFGLFVDIDDNVYEEVLTRNNFSIEATTIVLLDILNRIKNDQYKYKGLPYHYHLSIDKYREYFRKEYDDGILYSQNKDNSLELLSNESHWHSIHDYVIE